MSDTSIEDEKPLENSDNLLNLWRAPTLNRPTPAFLQLRPSLSVWNGRIPSKPAARQKKQNLTFGKCVFYDEIPVDAVRPELAFSSLSLVYELPPSEREDPGLSIADIHIIYRQQEDPTVDDVSRSPPPKALAPAQSDITTESPAYLGCYPISPMASTRSGTPTVTSSMSAARHKVLDPNRRCGRCGNLSHEAPTCTDPQPFPQKGTCFKCGNMKHDVANCPRTPKEYCFRCGSREHVVKGCDAILKKTCFRCGGENHTVWECSRSKHVQK